MPENANAIRH